MPISRLLGSLWKEIPTAVLSVVSLQCGPVSCEVPHVSCGLGGRAAQPQLVTRVLEMKELLLRFLFSCHFLTQLKCKDWKSQQFEVGGGREGCVCLINVTDSFLAPFRELLSNCLSTVTLKPLVSHTQLSLDSAALQTLLLDITLPEMVQSHTLPCLHLARKCPLLSGVLQPSFRLCSLHIASVLLTRSHQLTVSSLRNGLS